MENKPSTFPAARIPAATIPLDMDSGLTMRTLTRTRIIAFVGCMLLASPALSDSAGDQYKRPSADISALLTAPPPPTSLVHHASGKVALLYREATMSMARLSQPYIGLAGFRFNPETRRSGVGALLSKVEIISTDSATFGKVSVWEPADKQARLDDVQFSPDGRYLSAQLVSTGVTRLSVFDTQTGTARVFNTPINPAWGSPCQWFSRQEMLCRLVSKTGKFSAPALNQPVVIEHDGGAAPVRTYSNLLKNTSGALAFEHYFAATLARVDVHGASTPLNKISGLIEQMTPSPDGKMVVIKRLQQPFSNLVRADQFPSTIEIWDLATQQQLYQSNVAGYNVDTDESEEDETHVVRKFVWREDIGSSIGWIQRPADDSKEKVYRWMNFHQGVLQEIAVWPKPIREFGWTSSGTPYFASRSSRNKSLNYYVIENKQAHLLASIETRDKYENPGKALRTDGDNGPILEINGKIYLSGDGLSDAGVQPFLDEVDLESGRRKRVFEAEAGVFEKVIGIKDAQAQLWITSRETQKTSPNFFLVSATERKSLRAFANPYPQLDQLDHTVVRYQRGDGVELRGTLYRPKNVPAGTPLPTLIWIYPYEYSDVEYAEQVNERWFQFPRISGPSPISVALAGYAVLVKPSMPIIQEGDELNENYLAELTASAAAAVRYLTESGISAPGKIAVGGQSYGAFSSANLLIHTDLFDTAVVLSGAYNRTLTPFGFQRENRSLWDASEFYMSVSPFFYANDLTRPILIMHGAEDENTGTPTFQSTRFFHALVGEGATARLVVLPYEGHHFRGTDTVLDTVAEMVEWLDKTIGKDAAPLTP
jgi:dipeptidyl aminopeptidase/acylaminoacyl peptidase